MGFRWVRVVDILLLFKLIIGIDFDLGVDGNDLSHATDK